MADLSYNIINKFVKMFTESTSNDIVNTFLASISKIDISNVITSDGKTKQIQTIFVIIAGNDQELPATIMQHNTENINVDIRVGDTVIVKIENHGLTIIEDITNPAAILDIPNSIIDSIVIGNKLYFIDSSRKNKIELASITPSNNIIVGNSNLEAINLMAKVTSITATNKINIGGSSLSSVNINGRSVLINSKKPILVGELFKTASCKSANTTIASKAGARISATAPTISGYKPILIYSMDNPHTVAWHITRFGTSSGNPFVNVYNNGAVEYDGQFTFYIFYIRES